MMILLLETSCKDEAVLTGKCSQTALHTGIAEMRHCLWAQGKKKMHRVGIKSVRILSLALLFPGSET